MWYLDCESRRGKEQQQVAQAVVDEEGKGELETNFRHWPETKENGPRWDELEKGNRNRGAKVVVTTRGVKNPLRHCQPRLHKRKFVQENLQVSFAPSGALFENFGKFVRRLADGEDFVMIRHGPTHCAETERQQGILGKTTDGEITDVLERIGTDGKVGSAAVHRRPLIQRRFDTMEEGNVQVIPHILVRVDIVEKLRRLHESDWPFAFLREDGEHAPQVVSARHEIGVKDDDCFSLRSPFVVNVMERVVDVSGLGVMRDSGQLGASDVMQVDVFLSATTKNVLLQVFAATIIEDVDVNVESGTDIHVNNFVHGSGDDFERFLVSGYHDTDCVEFRPFERAERRFRPGYPFPQGKTLNEQRRTRDNFQTSDDGTVNPIQSGRVKGECDSDVDVGQQGDAIHRVQRLVNVVLVFLEHARDRDGGFRGGSVIVHKVLKVSEVFHVVCLAAAGDPVVANHRLARFHTAKVWWRKGALSYTAAL